MNERGVSGGGISKLQMHAEQVSVIQLGSLTNIRGIVINPKTRSGWGRVVNVRHYKSKRRLPCSLSCYQWAHCAASHMGGIGELRRSDRDEQHSVKSHNCIGRIDASICLSLFTAGGMAIA
jgi:hypothetical protein